MRLVFGRKGQNCGRRNGALAGVQLRRGVGGRDEEVGGGGGGGCARWLSELILGRRECGVLPISE